MADAHVALAAGDDRAIEHQLALRTDSNGRLETMLDVGRSYCAWAIGPPNKDGVCEVIAPRFDATGGQVANWRTSHLARPTEIRVRGVNGLKASPSLRLRVMPSRVGVAAEMKLDGDGFVKLPPLPTEIVTLALVDEHGTDIDQRTVDLTEQREVEFGPFAQFQFVVLDPDDAPVGGVTIFERRTDGHPFAAPLRAWTRIDGPDRELATTDANGHASVTLVALREDDVRLFYGTHPNWCGPYSGYVGEQPFVANGRGNTDAKALTLRMERAKQHSLRVTGAPDGAALTARLDGTWRCVDEDDFPTVVMETSSPAQNLEDGEAQAAIYSMSTPTWLVRGRTTIAVENGDTLPVAISARVAATSDTTALDLEHLRTIDVRVVDASGEAVPHAVVASAPPGSEMAVQWQGVVVTNADGRARIRIDGELGATRDVYAYSPAAHGVAKTTLMRYCDVEVTVESFVEVTFEVRGADGEPAYDAHLAPVIAGFPNTPLGNYAMDSYLMPRWGRTDRNGKANALVPKQLLPLLQVQARQRDARSQPQALSTDGVHVELPRSR